MTIKEFVNNEKVASTVSTLYVRFLDEGKYEDIQEYANVFSSVASEIGADITDVIATKKPFGMKFKMDNQGYHLFVKRAGNSVKIMAKCI